MIWLGHPIRVSSSLASLITPSKSGMSPAVSGLYILSVTEIGRSKGEERQGSQSLCARCCLGPVEHVHCHPVIRSVIRFIWNRINMV